MDGDVGSIGCQSERNGTPNSPAGAGHERNTIG
jgi:hypothetical protein